MSGTAALTREDILYRYDHYLPQDMGDGPYELFEVTDQVIDTAAVEVREFSCTVAVAGDIAFCLTCEAHGHLDGYSATHDGVERWHRSL